MKFTIVVHPFSDKSMGIMVMHQLCNDLNKMGHLASIVFIVPNVNGSNFSVSNDDKFYGPNYLRHEFEDENECQEYVKSSIVIYPEVITGNPLGAERVVRYLLNREGFVGRNRMNNSDDDFILAFSKIYHDNPHAILFKVSHNSIFNVKASKPALRRSIDLTYIGKGSLYDDCFVIKNTIELARQWPKTKAELALLLKNSRYYYTWDCISQTNTDAIFCGVIPIFMSALPLNSFEDMHKTELGQFPAARLVVKDNIPSVEIPDNFSMTVMEFKENYLNYVNDYQPRLSMVVDKILGHFAD